MSAPGGEEPACRAELSEGRCRLFHLLAVGTWAQCDFAMPRFSSSVLSGSEMTRGDTWNSAEHRLDAQEADANVISESRVHF